MAAKQTPLEADVVIVGAGLVGLTAAIALSRLGKRVVLTDARAPVRLDASWAQDSTSWDSRIYALTNASMRWLAEIGVWARVPAHRVNPIAAMHLWAPSQAHASPSLCLPAADANLPHMGCIVESCALMEACWQVLAECPEVTVITDALALGLQQSATGVTLQLPDRQIEAALLLGADGAHSWVRAQSGMHADVVDFAQTAIVCNYVAEDVHHDVARQWFGRHETLALLPMPQQQVSLVWALPQAQAQALLALSGEDLAQAVQQRCGHVLGRLTPQGPAQAFPLLQQTARQAAWPHVMLLGDAAHQVHPMAGQGVNLGFQDVITLAAALQALPAIKPIGEPALLRHVARVRQKDVLKMHALTRGLDSLFSRPQALWTHAALLGLAGVENSTLLKRLLIRTATGA